MKVFVDSSVLIEFENGRNQELLTKLGVMLSEKKRNPIIIHYFNVAGYFLFFCVGVFIPHITMWMGKIKKILQNGVGEFQNVLCGGILPISPAQI